MECVEFFNQKKYIEQFIKFGHSLYSKSDDMQNDKELRQILTNTHVLSKYFELAKFLILDNKKVVGRFVITKYPNDNTAYFGYFECINDEKTAKFLFENAYMNAQKQGLEKIIGPVDCSFWIKYRLKINMFDKLPYTGEPYNKDYYYNLFKNNGYLVCEHYSSSIYNKPDKDFENLKYSSRLDEFKKEGYEIVSPYIENFDEVLKQVYAMIMELYSDFPIFKEIEEKDFLEQFDSYKNVLDTKMVKMAYYNGKAVGFYISVPNYNNLVYHTNNIINIVKILRIKKKPLSYVMLYMGVDRAHTGLGKALVQSIIEELKHLQVTSIGALQKDGKITQKYIEELIEERYEYVLLEKEIK